MVMAGDGGHDFGDGDDDGDDDYVDGDYGGNDFDYGDDSDIFCIILDHLLECPIGPSLRQFFGPLSMCRGQWLLSMYRLHVESLTVNNSNCQM